MPLRPIYQISNGDVESTLLNNIDTAYIGAVPKITSLTYPNNTNAAANGQTIQINGTNFTASSLVWVDYNQASSVSFVDANTITFSAPSKQPNTYVTHIVNPDGAAAMLVPGINYDSVSWSTPANGDAYTVYVNTAITPVSLSATSSLQKTITYSVVSGNLPANLSISSSSLVGTPNTKQTNTAVVIRATAADTLVYSDRTLYYTVEYTKDLYITADTSPIVDSSGQNHTVTLGSASRNTTTYYAGNASIYIPSGSVVTLGGTGNTAWSFNDASNGGLGCFEMMMYMTTAGLIFSKTGTGSTFIGWSPAWQLASGTWQAGDGNGGSSGGPSFQSLLQNKWAKVAFVRRSSGNFDVYVDDAYISSVGGSGSRNTTSNLQLGCGSVLNGTYVGFGGYLDEIKAYIGHTNGY